MHGKWVLGVPTLDLIWKHVLAEGGGAAGGGGGEGQQECCFDLGVLTLPLPL